MKNKALAAMAGIFLLMVSCTPKYETVSGDPLGTKIYTLENGLKVYMTVNKDEPRLQTMIAFRTGGKTDPSDNTGLAHYLEHLMFKGSENLGTSDYAAEKVYLDQVADLYEVYRVTEDPAERKAIYHKIDSLSYIASTYGIPNEYDKSMAVIGSRGTNAFTGEDVTCYVENIPSNQIDTWAKIQADRFMKMVIRGVHTELETVYEEYNMYLYEDSDKVLQSIDSVLYKHHPYGSQTVIGTQDHLKNPSINTIYKQFQTYYVPNNAAICVSGDFDPDEFVKTIEKYFGEWKSAPVPEFSYEAETPITSPVERHIMGNDTEFLYIGWRIPGEKDWKDSEISEIASAVLNNGMAGLIDIDINQQQKALQAGSGANTRSDYGDFLLIGYPKDGQSLEEVRDLLLAEVAKLRNGEFDEDLVAAAVANFKLRQMRGLENNRQRAMLYVNSFIAGHDWADDVHQMDRLSKVTKADVVAWANKYLGANSYVAAFKHTGVDPNIKKIEAPEITPIAMNRDKQSAFLQEIQGIEVKEIEPVFVDFSKEMSTFKAQSDIEVLYKTNEKNDIASVTFSFDEGSMDDPALGLALNYISYLGTPARSSEQIAKELYKLACNQSNSVNATSCSYGVSGISANIGAALEIIEDLMANAIPDEDILANLKADLLKSRADNKFNQRACNSALQTYIMYGPEYIKATTLSNEAMMALTSEELLAKVSNLLSKQHKVLYYGPASESDVKALLADHHDVAGELQPLQKKHAMKVQTPEAKVFIAPYDSRQFNYIQYTNSGEKFELADAPYVNLYNEYFGSGMNTVVFQEMREARALAYSARATLQAPVFTDDSYSFNATIGSQNDKLQTAVEAFDEIINNMPESEKSFEIAKTALDGVLRTQRTTGQAVLSSYLNCQELGLSEPASRIVFEALPNLTISDLSAIQQKRVKDRTYIYGLLGDYKDMDMNFLRTLGPVRILSLEEIFGY